VVHSCNPSTWEAEAGGSQTPGQLCYIARDLVSKHTQKNVREKKQEKGRQRKKKMVLVGEVKGSS
jgi:hypothetical protein